MYDKEWRERERVGEVARAMERERDSMKKMGERERGRGGEVESVRRPWRERDSMTKI